jgi:hypothetical protein
VFDDLAHHIVHSTTLSLTQASTLLSKSTSPTDAALFLVCHLLLLKQQIVAFDIEFVTPETEVQYDLSSITNTFWELRSRGGLFNPRNLVGLLIPKVVENMLDAKAEVDARLRQAITDLTTHFSSRIVAPIDGKKVPAQEGPARTAKVRQNVEHESPFLRKKLEEYISDYRTREMLVQAVMESVTQKYEDWFDESYVPATNGSGRSTKGKGREDGVWDPEVFGEWCTGIFGIGNLGLGIRDGDGGSERDEDDEDEDGGSSSSPEEESVSMGRQMETGGLRINM